MRVPTARRPRSVQRLVLNQKEPPVLRHVEVQSEGTGEERLPRRHADRRIARFTLESRQSLRIGGEHLRQDLDRNRPAERRIGRPMCSSPPNRAVSSRCHLGCDTLPG